MSLQSEIMAEVYGAVSDALVAAEDNWRRTPSLHAAAMLTGTSVRSGFDSAEGELTFETHREKIPAVRRDMYGVAGKTIVIQTGQRVKKASPATLMQKTEESLESGFIRSIGSRKRVI